MVDIFVVLPYKKTKTTFLLCYLNTNYNPPNHKNANVGFISKIYIVDHHKSSSNSFDVMTPNDIKVC